MSVYVATGKEEERADEVRSSGLAFAGKVFAKDVNARQVFE
jgi:hypothetical protein